MHYNNESRTKRLVTANEYKQLVGEHPNLVATKNMKDDVAFLTELHEKAPQLQHFLSEFGYLWLRDRFKCGFLASLAITNPQRAREFFTLRGEALRKMEPEFHAATKALFEAVGEPIYIDAAYDKLLYKLRKPAFPLRLLPPYISMEESVRERYWQTMERLAPPWLPNDAR
jgi:dihydrodipicolinate synthase/N-acetylneuraminate lyase